MGDGEGDGHAAQSRRVLDAEAAAGGVARREQAGNRAIIGAREHLSVLVNSDSGTVAEHMPDGLLSGVGIIGRLGHADHQLLLFTEILVKPDFA